jgi:integrase
MMAATGIRQRHGNRCTGGRCSCPWEASVYSKADAKKLRKSFASRAEALEWQHESRPAVRKKIMRAPVAMTIEQAGEAWLEGARKGLVLTRSGDPYKPAAVRAYEAALRLRVYPAFGDERLSELTRIDLQVFVNKLTGEIRPSTVVVTLLPLRAIYKQAMELGTVAVNPTTGLNMPAVRGGRDRIAPPDECSRLLAALAQADRALWATAMFAGLRRGELMALRIEDVDLGAGVIHVRRGWDYKEGEIATKSGKDRRVPIAAILRDYLDEHLLGLAWKDGLVFGSTAGIPFTGTPTTDRAKKAWTAAKLQAITLHECRHTFASLMIAAGVNAKALSTYMGHANIGITLDRYGHLMPGNEVEAAGLLDAYLQRADTAARLAQIEAT